MTFIYNKLNFFLGLIVKPHPKRKTFLDMIFTHKSDYFLDLIVKPPPKVRVLNLFLLSLTFLG